MGREIDERVVQMKFENGQFEKGISTSIRSMEELKKGMNFDDAVKGFNKLDETAKGFKLTGLASGVDAVRVKFDLLQITAFNVLNRISNKAIDTGERMIKGLSIDQVSVGWDKFASKTTAVQTIMAATASQFSDTSVQMAVVNEQLDKLNWFTDETSYNFVDMVNNIGKFTSNNIDLETSVTAMQGIANWAAISGANANEASRAMYNLSQALSTGSVKLIDWKSIENANMATAEFKKTVIEMAGEVGSLRKISEDTFETLDGKIQISTTSFSGFNDSLSKGWFNTQVLMNSLDRYGRATDKLNKYYEETGLLTSDLISGIDDYTAGIKTAEQISKEWDLALEQTQTILEDFNNEQDQFGLKALKAAQEAKTFEDAINSVKDAVSTGWMKSFEYIFGDYLEAKEFFTDLANALYSIFAEGAEDRNKMLALWKEDNGRDYFIDTIWNGLAAIMAILKPIQTAWTNIFGEMTAERLLSITKSLHAIVDNLSTMAVNNMPRLERIFSGLFAVVDILVTILRSAASAVGRVISALFPFAGGVFDAAASLGDLLVSLDKVIKESQIFDRIFGSIADVLVSVINIIKAVGSAFGELISGGEKINGFSTAIIHPVNMLESIFVRLSTIATGIGNTINKIIDSFKSGGSSLKSISNLFTEALEGFTDPFGDGFLNGMLDIVNSGLFVALLLQLKKFINKLGGFDITKVFKNFRNAFEALGETIGAFEANINAKTLQTIATAILTLAAALLILATINPERLTGALGAISVLFIELSISMKAFSKAFSGKFSLKVTKISTLMIGFSAAILILSAALKKLSGIDTDSLAFGLGATVTLIGAITIALKALSSITKRIRVSSVMLLSLAASINILAVAVSKLGGTDMYQLRDGLLSVGVLLGELVVFINLISGAKVSMRSSVAIVSIAASLSILSGVVHSISSIPISGLQSSIIAIAALLTEIGLFMKFSGKEKGMLSLSVSLTIFASAISVLSKSLVTLSVLSMQNIVEGIIAIGAALGIVGLALKTFPKDSLSLSVSLILLSTALRSILSAVTEYSDLSGVAKGLVAVGGALVVIGTGLRFMQKNGLTVSLTLIAFAAALRILSPALKELSELGIGNLINMLGGLAVAFVGLGLLAAVLEPISPALRSLSATIAIFSASVLALGIGVTMLSVGLTSLGGAAVIGVGGLSVALLEIISLIPLIIKEIGVGIIALADVIAEGAPHIANAFIALVMAGLDALSETVPEIVDRLLEIFQKIIATLLERIPSLGDALGELFHGFSTEGFKEFAIALSLILGSIVGSMKILQKSKGIGVGAIATLGVMVIASGLIGIMLAKFSSMTNPTTVIPLATAISEVFIALAASFRIIGKSGSEFKIDIVSLGVMVAAISIIGLALAAFSNITDPSGVMPLATALSFVMLALAETIKIMSSMAPSLSNIWSNVAAFAVLSVIAGILGAVIAKISQIVNPEGVISIAASLSLVLLSIAGVVAIVNTFHSYDLVGSWNALAQLGVVILALGALTVLLGELMKSDGFKTTLANGTEAMKMFGEAIGGFFGGIVKGFASGILSVLPDLGLYLSQFMENAQYFFDSVKNLPDGLGSKVAGLAGAIIAIGAADFLTAALNFAKSVFGESSSDMASKFENFGEAISAFSNALGDGFDASKVEAAANAGKALADLEKSLPRKGGVLQSWLGEQDLEEFGDRLEEFGDALFRFGETIKDLDTDAVTAAAAAGTALSNLENSLPAQGGKLQEWIGEKDLGDFGRRIVLFGAAIKAFSIVVQGLDADAVEAAANAGQLLADLEDNVPRQNGMLQQFLGSENIGDFGARLFQFGLGLKLFSIAVSNLNTEAIASATVAAAALVEMEKQVDTSGGWGELFTGKSDFSSFGDNLKQLGEGLKAYNTSISAIVLDKVTAVTAAVEDLVAIAKNPNSVFERIKTMGAAIKDYAPSIGVWSSNASTADTDSMATVTGEIEKLLKLSELTSASQWIADITTHASSMIAALVSNIQGKEQRLRMVGKDVAYWIVKGFESGELAYEYLASAAASKLAKKIQESVETELGIASPSTVMIEEGHWVVKGLAEGISADMSAEEAAEKKASNIVAAFQAGLDKLDLLAQNRQLKYDVWSVNEGLGATDYEKQQYELQLKQGELEDAAANVQAQNAAFEAAKKTFEEGSQQYIEAENRMLEAMKKMYEIRNEISQMQSEMLASGGDSIRRNNDAYIAYIKENEEAYKMLGMSEEQLIEDAKKKTGFGMENTEFTAESIDTQAIIDRALSQQQVDIIREEVSKRVSKGVSGGVDQGLDKGLGDPDAGTDPMSEMVEKAKNMFSGTGLDKLETALYGGGSEASGSFTDGFTNTFKDNMNNSFKASFDFASEAIKGSKAAGDVNSPSKVMYGVGTNYAQGMMNGLSDMSPRLNTTGKSIGANTVEGLRQGLIQKEPALMAEAQRIANQVADTMRRALQINSPSKLTQSFGNYLDDGLALGMRERIPEVENATYDVSNAMASALDETKYLINSILESDDDFSPVITPVLNLDEMKAQGRQIGRIFPRQSIDLQSARLKVGSIADQTAYGQNGSSKNGPQTNYNFTQNNYSPKALNRSEIYRQTRNQFSRLKGVTQR